MDQGKYNRYTHNLVTRVVFGTDKMKNMDYIAGFDLLESISPILINNTVAGSERAGYKIRGETCRENNPRKWSGNTAHSALHGIFIFKEGLAGCLKIADFVLYRNYDFGIYTQVNIGNKYLAC